MKHTYFLSVLLFAANAFAQSDNVPAGNAASPEPAAPAPAPEIHAPFDRPQEPFSDKERDSLLLAKKWLEAPEKPRMSPDGKITYLFGTTMPTVFGSPLRNSDIELEPGEKVREGGINIGDTVRWLVAPAISGPDNALTTHIILKPKDVGLTTTLVVNTDRRTYHFLLKSTENEWTPRIGFEYPENIENAWRAYQARVAQATAARTIPETQQDMGTLDFAYEVKGDSPAWKPVRIYNDGVKTYIQMPRAMQQTEAPALLVIGSDKKTQMVNYRLIGDRYIVDQIFERAQLVAGVGRKATKVLIRRLPRS